MISVLGDKIPLARPWIDGDEVEEAVAALRSGWLSRGPYNRKFEAAVAEYLGVNPEKVIAVTNCTAALHLALLISGIGPGDEVIIPDFTFPATGFAVAYTGAKPVIVDIDPERFTMSPAALMEAITVNTKAIIPVHLFGNPAEMDEIRDIAAREGIKVIEDAACSLGAKYDGLFTGTLGDFGCFSFHPRKVITTGEGGILVCRDIADARRARMLSEFGIPGAWERAGAVVRRGGLTTIPEFTMIGYNYKMSDINAAIGVAQMRKLEQSIEYRDGIARAWRKLLRHPSFVHPRVALNDRHAWQAYVVTVPDPEIRWLLMSELWKAGIEAGIGTYSLQKQPIFQSIGRIEPCPVSADIEDRTVALPIFPGLELDRRVDLPEDFFEPGTKDL